MKELTYKLPNGTTILTHKGFATLELEEKEKKTTFNKQLNALNLTQSEREEAHARRLSFITKVNEELARRHSHREDLPDNPSASFLVKLWKERKQVLEEIVNSSG